MTVDLKDRVGTITAGNANLIVNKGDLITGDGEQCVYLRADTGANGDVLTLDNTADEGFSWQPGGGGGGSILTTKGDLLTHDGTTAVRLPVGADGDVLTADSTQPDGIKWAAGGGGGGNGDYAAFFRNPVAGFGTIGLDTAVPFSSDGPTSGPAITRFGVLDGEFVLAAAATYDISWMVSVDEAGQLALFLDDGAGYLFQPETLAGRATGTNQISNRVIITTTTPNAKIKIVNHSSSAGALTMTPLPGGTSAGATYLVIMIAGGGAVGPAGPPGASTTGSNGVTVAANNATNDLVTGTSVAQINATTTGDIAITGTGVDSDVTITSSGAAGDMSLVSGADINANATGGFAVTSGGTASIISGGGGLLQAVDAILIHSTTNEVTLLTDATHNLNITAGQDELHTVGRDEVDTITRDETHVIGRNLSMTAAGSLGITLHATHATAGNVDVSSDHGDVILEAPDVTNKLQLQTAVTAVISEFGGTGAARSAAIANAAGGTVIDIEARTALNALLTYFRLRGTIAP
jgi:hypothetical protein